MINEKTTKQYTINRREKDHENRPLWVCPNGVKNMKQVGTVQGGDEFSRRRCRTDLETGHTTSTNSQRRRWQQWYRSDTELILRTLRKFSKQNYRTVKNFIEECTMALGGQTRASRTILRGISRKGDSEHAAPESKD